MRPPQLAILNKSITVRFYAVGRGRTLDTLCNFANQGATIRMV